MEKSLSLPNEFLNGMNPTQKDCVKIVEDRIEQRYKAIDLILSLNVINGIVGKNPDELTDAQRQILEDGAPFMEELHRAICKGEETQLDKDRRAIWDMVRRGGVAYVLTFVDSQIVTNIEKFFVGLVITYVAMFTSGRREPLKVSDVFVEGSSEETLHQYFFNLRNTWYAHNTRPDGRHRLKYSVDQSGALIFDKNGEQITPEYHNTQFKNLFICVMHTMDFIEKDIDARVQSFMGTLSMAQRDTLCQHWKAQQSQTN